jgi:hypothetical protein
LPLALHAGWPGLIDRCETLAALPHGFTALAGAARAYGAWHFSAPPDPELSPRALLSQWRAGRRDRRR